MDDKSLEVLKALYVGKDKTSLKTGCFSELMNDAKKLNVEDVIGIVNALTELDQNMQQAKDMLQLLESEKQHE